MGLNRLNKTKPEDFSPHDEALRVIKASGVDRLASQALLFGSAARDDFSTESDIDVLLVFKSQHLLEQAKLKLYGVRPYSEWPFDWILKTEEDFDKRSEIGGVCYIAKREGKRLL